MSDRKIEVEIDDEAQEGMTDLMMILEKFTELLRDQHLYTREELLEYFTEYHALIMMIFTAGLMNIETQLLIQDIENPQ